MAAAKKSEFLLLLTLPVVTAVGTFFSGTMSSNDFLQLWKAAHPILIYR